MVLRVPPPPPFKRRLFSVGVTGTNGKTTTTAWVAAALASRGPVVRSTTVGLFLDDRALDVPKSYRGFVDAMRMGAAAGGRFAAIELTSEALARGFAKAWPVEVGVFTNLSHDHLDAHGCAEHYLASKAQLFMWLPRGGTAVFNGCDPSSKLLATIVPDGVRIWHYGLASRGAPVAELDLAAEDVRYSWRGTEVDLRHGKRLPPGPRTLRVPAVGEVFAENALAAYLAAVAAGIEPATAADAISRAAPPPGRFQVVSHNPYVVVDYAHTPDALARTLLAARRLCRGELTVVFGAGGERDTTKRAAMGASASACDRVVLTSDNPRGEDPARIVEQIAWGIADGVSVDVELDRRSAIARAIGRAGPHDVIVVAGRGHETEQLVGTIRMHLSDVDVARAAARFERPSRPSS